VADEVIVTSQIYDHNARKRSIAIAVEAMQMVVERTGAVLAV
jgi:hypothetical protein